MRKILVFAVFAMAVALIGCPKKKGDDADAAAADAAAEAGGDTAAMDAAAAPQVNAKNAADVARFAAETAMSEPAKTASLTTVHTSPKGGSVVASLKPGTDVTKVASYQESFLITFADPKDAASTLMGWVNKEGFVAWTAPHDAGVRVVDAGSVSKLVTCPMGLAPVVITVDAVCRRKCTKDADCKKNVPGACQNANSQGGGVARVCVNDT